jgi:hypothetical protein
MHPILFSLLNLVFVSFAQSVLIFMFASAPAYVILLTNQVKPALNLADKAFFGLLVAFVFAGFVADQQQWGTICPWTSFFNSPYPPPAWSQGAKPPCLRLDD